MGRSVYTDRNPSLIRELFIHEVVNEDVPANMKLALDNYHFLRYKTTMGHQPILWKRKSPNETTTTNYIEEKRVVIMYPLHLWTYAWTSLM